MDLLDDLDFGPVKAKTFKKSVDIQIRDEDIIENDTQEVNQSEDDFLNEKDERSHSYSTFDKSDDTTQVMAGVPNISNLFNTSTSSILNRVMKRLNGEVPSENDDVTALEETQKLTSLQVSKSNDILGSSEDDLQPLNKDSQEEQQDQNDPTSNLTQNIESVNVTPTQIPTKVFTQEQTQELTQGPTREPTQELTQAIEAERQIEASSNLVSLTLKDSGTFFEENDDDENGEISQNNIDTQAIEDPGLNHSSKPRTNLFLMDSEEENDDDDEILEEPKTQNDDIAPTQAELREKKLQELASKKKTERLLKEQQEREKENKTLEVPKEDSKNNDGEQDDYRSASEDETQVAAVIDFGKVVKKKFQKSSLFAAFGLSNVTNNEDNNMSSPQVEEHDTPITSPAKADVTRFKNDIDLSESDDEDFEVIDLLKTQNDVSRDPKVEKSETLKFKESLNRKDAIELDDSDSELEVEYSKSAILDIKAKFSKKSHKPKAQTKDHSSLSKRQLFNELLNANRVQMKSTVKLQPTRETDILKEESINVESLLQRHIEHNRKIREQEEEARKLQEDGDYGEDYDEDAEFEDSDVPDSDFGEDGDQEDSNENDDKEGNEAPLALKNKERHKRRMVVESDDDDANDDNDKDTADGEAISKTGSVVSQDERERRESVIHLGDFGGNLSQTVDSDKPFAFGNKFKTLSQLYDEGTQEAQLSQGGNIFDKLNKRNNKVLGDESFNEPSEAEKSFQLLSNGNLLSKGAPAFEEHDTQLEDVIPPSLSMKSTQGDHVDSEKTQQLEATVADNFDEYNDDNDGETQADDHLPTKRLVRRTIGSDDESSENESDHEDVETEEQIQAKQKLLALMRQQRRQEEKEQRKKRSEMKAKGLDKIMEAEAEESEDEWFGIGGKEGEGSDVENSEDEKMFDDFSKVKSNRAALAKRLLEENVDVDRKMVERILTDLETGKLRKRGQNDLDLDISDGEDEVMRSYRLYNQLKMRQQLEENEALSELAKDQRSKAFFESITEDSQLDSRKNIFASFDHQASDDDSDEDKEKENHDPFVETPKKEEFKDPSMLKKKVKITEKFVHKTLSFLSNGDDEPSLITHKRRYSETGDDSFTEDLSTLKQNTVIKLPDHTPQRKRKTDDELITNDSSPTNLFKIPSIINRSLQSFENESIKNNEVTVSTSYKASSSSRASVMSFGKRMEEKTKMEIKDQRVLKVRKVSKAIQKGNRLKSLSSVSSFD